MGAEVTHFVLAQLRCEIIYRKVLLGISILGSDALLRALSCSYSEKVFRHKCAEGGSFAST